MARARALIGMRGIIIEVVEHKQFAAYHIFVMHTNVYIAVLG